MYRYQKLPAIFFGHGSPMNALENNEITRAWRGVVQDIPRPRAILCISAHWLTRGTRVTAGAENRTIHDFAGFPPELYAMTYPAPGDPELAAMLRDALPEERISLSYDWGLDHGTWSVFVHAFPEATIPVIQLSLDVNKTPAEHFSLGRKLSLLREENILLTASGNIIHNLYRYNWQHPEEQLGWALSFNKTFHSLLTERNFEALCALPESSPEARLAIPTTEHYLPFLYIAAQVSETSTLTVFNDVLLSSLSMTGVRVDN